MKNLFLILLPFLLFNALYAQEKKAPIENKFQAEIKFEEELFDFGTIKEGEIVTKEFRFTNVGDSILLIKDVKTSCGCTVTEWPKGIIKPGESEVIKVIFNSAGKPGRNRKSIVVISNSKKGNVTITISGTVGQEEKPSTPKK